MRGYLLMGTRATDGGGRKNHGKPASPPTELGANKTSYASAKIGVETCRDGETQGWGGLLGLGHIAVRLLLSVQRQPVTAPLPILLVLI